MDLGRSHQQIIARGTLELAVPAVPTGPGLREIDGIDRGVYWHRRRRLPGPSASSTSARTRLPAAASSRTMTPQVVRGSWPGGSGGRRLAAPQSAPLRQRDSIELLPGHRRCGAAGDRNPATTHRCPWGAVDAGQPSNGAKSSRRSSIVAEGRNRGSEQS
jgi:hypothetical protein